MSTMLPEGEQPVLRIVPMPADKKHSVVVLGDFVTAGDGSGMVHMAPAFGADDYEAGKRFGLAMVRRSIERMGGRVGLESTLGAGSRFWVELPESGGSDVDRS